MVNTGGICHFEGRTSTKSRSQIFENKFLEVTKTDLEIFGTENDVATLPYA